MFANESNNISATIKNNGTGNADAFNVSFEVGTFSEQVSVAAGLPADENVTVSVTDPTIRTAGDSVTINVTADFNGGVNESDESNNALNITKTVVNNGYKGKRYTGGEDLETIQEHTLKGNISYSVGDSYYLSAYYNSNWTTYKANWTANNLSIPETATIKKARLYVHYTWDKADVMPDEANLTFNNETQTLDKHYSDRKGHGYYNYPYGMLAYNVTADFNASSNTAVLTNSHPGGDNVSMRGMVLVVIYADESEPERTIYLNEEFDMLYGGSYKCTTPEEATAYAPFPGAGELENVKKATLITVAPGASGPEGELIFNGQTWYDVWNFAGSSQIGINETDVTSLLNATANEAGFQSSGDFMEASNAILVLEAYKGAEISIEPKSTIVQPQDQFDVNITVNPIGNYSIYGVEYYLKYNTSVVKAETQNKGPSLGGYDDTIVVSNEIDHANGVVSYAETIKNSSGATEEGTVATIQFTAIGERGATTGLNLTGVIIVRDGGNEAEYIVNNGSAMIYDNLPPEAKGYSKFRYNYASKKFESLALLCSNSTNPVESKGYNITSVRWSFGDGQYGTSEGGLPDDARDGICVCKNHSYTSWKWNSTAGAYEPFYASVTVTDDGCPEASDTTEFDVMVHMAADANGDGKVNILDAVYVGMHFGEEGDRNCTPGPTCCEHSWDDPQGDAADLNNDCKINILDAVIVGTMWGHTAY